MGKSSRKKKHSDASPRARAKKSKSKKAQNKSKKVRHHRDSDSYSSDYDSPVSSYTSTEDDHRRRKRSRSHSRGNTRGSKKRIRRRSYSSESSEDSPPSRKRRGSRKNDELNTRKKTYKKKRKRHVSISSTSCSFCESGEQEFESRRGRSRRRDRHNHDVGKDKTVAVAERSAYRTRSSSCSKCSMSSHDQNKEERVISANSSMRLRSVIIVTNQANERKLDKDENKEEILYDNDYPSSRSNDSNNGGSKKETAYESYVESKITGPGEDFSEAAPNATSTLIDAKNECAEEQFEGSNPSRDYVVHSPLVKGKNGMVSDGAANEDLESVLRQKALENLKRFRAVSKADKVFNLHRNDDATEQTPAGTTVPAQMKSLEEVSTGNVDTTQYQGKRMSVWRRISTQTTSVDSNIVGREHEAAKPSPSRGSVQVSGGGSLGANVMPVANLSTNKPRMSPFTWRRDSGKTEPAAVKVAHLPKVHSQAKPLDVITRKDIVDLAKIGPSGDKSGRGSEENKIDGSAVPEHSSSSCPKPASGESTSSGVKEEAEGPQYEQRTMSVTRGDETIQVNYQVYIPKRAPALARRQLKR
ncbi:hypothetical protein SAY86_006330 [Trapa natans]|uniref:Uncharacterized protein n=1 Tax=Trapa natans TaxID=22666 RepID=A0AAN7QU67_TRANT|nr:hypothetical protein SAY86_006330 [Trapa natans]